MTLTLEGITLNLALGLGPLLDDGRVDFTQEVWINKDKADGVYAVICDEVLVYVGSYQRGLIKRWLYISKGDLYPFKKPLVVSGLRLGQNIRVYSKSVASIKQELGCADNVWVNASGIEARLIQELNPPWNRLGKKKQPL